jgi:hypothetical protein
MAVNKGVPDVVRLASELSVFRDLVDPGFWSVQPIAFDELRQRFVKFVLASTYVRLRRSRLSAHASDHPGRLYTGLLAVAGADRICRTARSRGAPAEATPPMVRMGP